MVWKLKEWLSTNILDSRLNFNKHPDFIHRRCQQRIFCLKKLRSINVSAAVFCTFYWSCIESVLTFSFLCWFAGLNVKSKNVLNKVVNVCGKVVGERQEHLSQLYECCVVWKAKVIVDDTALSCWAMCVCVCKYITAPCKLHKLLVCLIFTFLHYLCFQQLFFEF